MTNYPETENEISKTLSEEELENLKVVADYLCMDHLGDMCSFPRFEECFGAFFIDKEINLPSVFKDICGKKRKYITFKRLINSYIKYKTNNENCSKDFLNFMKLLNEIILKKNDEQIGYKSKNSTYFNTFNCKNKKAISKIAVITNEEKDIIKGFQIIYDDFFKNDLFQNDDKEKYYVSLELNLIADIPQDDKSNTFVKFPTRNDRDGITHLGGTYDENKINFLVFKCRSGKTSFIGKPNGTPFLYGLFKNQLHVIKIGITGGKLTFIEPNFDEVFRFNPNFDKSLNEINDDFLKNDEPIYEESLLINSNENIDDKNILQPLVNDDRFFNEKKYEDKISGMKFVDICPNCQINKSDKNTSNSDFKFDLQNIIDEAGSLHKKHQEKLKLLTRNLNNLIKKKFIRLDSNNELKNSKMSVADILRDTNCFDSLLFKVESILMNNIKFNARKKTEPLFERSDLTNFTEPNEFPQDNYHAKRVRRNSVAPFKEKNDISSDMNNNDYYNNNYYEFSDFSGDVSSFFNPFGYTGSSNYYINDFFENEQKNNEKYQMDILLKHQEEQRKKYTEAEMKQKNKKAQKTWRNFSERYSKNNGIFIIQTIGAVIKGLRLLREEKEGNLSYLSLEEKLRLLEILKNNRNIVIMLSKAHIETERRKKEEEYLKIELKEFEEMEEKEKEKEEKNILNEEQKNREEQTKILNEKYIILLEQMKRSKELTDLYVKIKEETDSEKKSILQKEEETKRLEDKRKKIEESKKTLELAQQQKKIEELKQNEKTNEENLQLKEKSEKIKKMEEENLQKQKDEEEFLANLQIKKVLNPENLPEIEAKIKFIENAINNNSHNYPEKTIKKLKDYKAELTKDLNTIKEALNKENQKKLSEELNFNFKESKIIDQQQRLKLKKQEDIRVQSKNETHQKFKAKKVNKVSISNVEIPKGTQIWHKQNFPNKGTIFCDNLFEPIKNNLCTINELGYWVLPNDVTQSDLHGWENIVWSRVENILATKNYQVFLDKIEEKDIIQGTLGDCYLLSAVAALCKYSNQIEKLFFIKEKSNEHCYGCYFKINGIWKLILIDDYFPCYGNIGKNFAFTSTNGNEIWVILLEKAWAKINGNYAKIIGGEPHEIFDLFTNAYSERIKVKTGLENEIWKKLSRGQNEGFLITAGTSGDTYYLNLEEVGLVPGHAYTILGIKQIFEGERLIHLRNPWGNGEWCGDWSDNSYRWNQSNRQECNQLVRKNDGEFWMSLSDFCKYFIVIGMCHLYQNYYYFVLHVPRKISKVGAFLTRLEVKNDCTHLYLMLHQKNPRVTLKDGTYQKSVISYIMLFDSNYNYIKANSDNSYHNQGIELNLNKGVYYLISDINYRYVQYKVHGYNISTYASSPVYVVPENNKNIEVIFKYGIYSYCKNYLRNGKSFYGGEIFQSNKMNEEFPFSFTLIDNKNGQNDLTLTDVLVCKGQKNVDYYFEGNNNKQNQIKKNICPGQWDMFCRIPYSRGSLYSIQLNSMYQPHRGPQANVGLAKLSGEIQPKLDVDINTLINLNNNCSINNYNNTSSNWNNNTNTNWNNSNININNNNTNSNWNNNINNINNNKNNNTNNNWNININNNTNSNWNNNINNITNNNWNNNINNYNNTSNTNWSNNSNINNYNNNSNVNWNNTSNINNYNNTSNINSNNNTNVNWNINNNNNYNSNINSNNNSYINNNQNLPKKTEDKKDVKKDVGKKEIKTIEKKVNNHFEDVFKQEGEPLDEYGLINQYTYQDNNGIYYIGFENRSTNMLKMYLSLQGLYDLNCPYQNIIEFISKPMTKNVFVLKQIEGYLGNFSYMFGQMDY